MSTSYSLLRFQEALKQIQSAEAKARVQTAVCCELELLIDRFEKVESESRELEILIHRVKGFADQFRLDSIAQIISESAHLNVFEFRQRLVQDLRSWKHEICLDL